MKTKKKDRSEEPQSPVTAGCQSTVFSCQSAHAEEVFLAGDFNGWEPEGTPMERIGKDEWSVQLELSPGRYEYKFVVDGRWCCSPGCVEGHACSSCVINEYGTMNRVVEVS